LASGCGIVDLEKRFVEKFLERGVENSGSEKAYYQYSICFIDDSFVVYEGCVQRVPGHGISAKTRGWGGSRKI
jgi:hypothetical protein